MSTQNNRQDIELVDPATCARIAAMSTKEAGHVRKNLLAYYTLINTWGMLVQTYSEFGHMHLIDAIKEKGLFPIIQEASDSSEEFIRGEQVRSALFSAIIEDITSCKRTDHKPLGVDPSWDPSIVILQVLRYPKRFSPVALPSVIEEGFETFLARERKNRILQKHWSQQTTLVRGIVARLRNAVLDILDWDLLCDRIEELLADPSNASITGGVARDANRTLIEKLRAIRNSNPEFFTGIMGYSVTGLPTTDVDVWYDRGSQYELKRTVRVASVPKSYKSSRIIAMEDTYRQGVAKAISLIIMDLLPENIKLHDQTQNQQLALMSSLDGLLATVDMKQASDSITKTLFWDIFPPRFSKLVYPYLGTHCEIGDKVYTMQMMATSGNALTFNLESIVFLAFNKAAQEEEELHSGKKHPSRYEGIPIPSVYGDDQIIWSDTFEYLVAFLEALGFVVNVTKSYTGNSPFRESCGLDAYLGVDVSSTYFPRKPIRGQISRDGQTVHISEQDATYDAHTGLWENSLVSLISLQKRLYYVSYRASLFLSYMVKETIPNMTTSRPGTETPDLWAYADKHVKRWAPGARSVLPEGPWSSDVEANYGRIYRYQPHPASKSKHLQKELSREDADLLNCYKYQQFLKNGPSYSDPLLKSLGISDAPVSQLDASALPTINWEIREWYQG